MNRRRSARTAVFSAERRIPLVLALLTLLLALAAAAPLRAQENFPRIGLSAAPDVYVDNLTVDFDSEFQLYALVTGFNPGDPINQPVSVMPWVIHQVCCGAVMEIVAITFNPALEHIGHPLAGTVSSVPECLDQDLIQLATLTVRLIAPLAGDYLWAAGPFGPIQDCDGTSPFFMSLPVTVTLEDNAAPADDQLWGAVKAMYR